MRYSLGLFLLLAGCHGSLVPAPVPVPLPETPCQMILRTEEVSCTTLQTGAEVGAPIPDPIKMYQAFSRGRARAALLFPLAANIKMSAFNFTQTTTTWNPGEAFPRIASGIGAGAEGETVLGINMYCSFEECFEHETVHGMFFLFDNAEQRIQAAIDNPADADQKAYGFIFIYQITCHATSDDPIVNEGPSISSSGRSHCILPYSGPPAP